MRPCRSAGAQCPREAVLTARVGRIGDRDLCRECFDFLVSLMGEDCRELDPNAYVPEWRQRSLQRDLTRRASA